MSEQRRDEFGEIFEDDLTENESKPRGSVRDEEEEKTTLDPDVDSEDDDRAMAENRFGVDDPQKR